MSFFFFFFSSHSISIPFSVRVGLGTELHCIQFAMTNYLISNPLV